MRGVRVLGGLILCGSLLALARGKQPMPPTYPAIKPDAARLDQTAGGLDGPGFSIAYSEPTGLLIAACEGGTLRYFNRDVVLGVRVGDRPAGALRGHAGPVIALAAAGNLVASGGVDGQVQLWSPPQDKPLHTLKLAGPVRAVALSPDGKVLAATGDDPAVQLWDTATGKPGTKLTGATDWGSALAFSPDGKTLAGGSFDGHWRLWEAGSGKKLQEGAAVAPPQPKMTPTPPSPVTAVAFGPDGKTLAVGSQDSQIYLFTVADGKFVRAIPGHGSAVTSLVFHPAGAVLASASKDRTLRLWNPANGQALKMLEGHTAWAQGVTFLLQGTRLASVGADHTVRLWDLTDPAKK
jgi:WD40 repeat protein